MCRQLGFFLFIQVQVNVDDHAEGAMAEGTESVLWDRKIGIL